MYLIPAFLDTDQILRDLNGWGWRDQKIETVCGFSSGYIAQVRCRNVKSMSYARGARLYNFWIEERAAHNRRLADSDTGSRDQLKPQSNRFS